MTAEGRTTIVHVLGMFWGWFRSTRMGRAFLWVWRVISWSRWLITIALFVGTFLWYAYIEGKDISGDLSADYEVVTKSQATLVEDALKLSDDLQNPNKSINLSEELSELKKYARATISTLGGLRSPTDTIEVAKIEYRDALQEMIGVANRIERGEIDGMAQPLHNGLQGVANSAGKLNTVVTDFQGGMWPQLIGSIF